MLSSRLRSLPIRKSVNGGAVAKMRSNFCSCASRRPCGHGLPSPADLVVGNEDRVADAAQQLCASIPRADSLPPFLERSLPGPAAPVRSMRTSRPSRSCEQGFVRGIVPARLHGEHGRLPVVLRKILHEFQRALHAAESHGREIVGDDKNAAPREIRRSYQSTRRSRGAVVRTVQPVAVRRISSSMRTPPQPGI